MTVVWRAEFTTSSLFVNVFMVDTSLESMAGFA
jgi:hypothetical protein